MVRHLPGLQYSFHCRIETELSSPIYSFQSSRVRNNQSLFFPSVHLNLLIHLYNYIIPYIVCICQYQLIKIFWGTLIDKTILSMIECYIMDDVQSLLATLKTKGWTNASIADAIAVSNVSVEKWQYGERNISPSHLILLNQLLEVIPPKKRRYTPGSRKGGKL